MKPGRNDPCSCGSGKKFKNCCQPKGTLKAVLPSVPSPAEIARVGNLFNAGHLQEAENQSRILAGQYPASAAIWKILGASQHLQGKNGIPALRKAVELQPADAAAHSNLGNAQKDLGQLEEAVTSYRRALKLKPNLAGIHLNLGIALMEIGQVENAIKSFRQALALEPNYAEIHSELGNALKDLGRPEEALECYRRALALKPDLDIAHNNLLFVMNYSPDYTPSFCLEKAKEFGRMVSSKVKGRFTSWRCASKPTRLRVGIVSGDLRNHPVGYFLENILARLDTSRLELVAYPTHTKEDALTARIKPNFAAWKPLVYLQDEAAARMIHGDGVNVLIDLSGHSRYNRLPVFAWKPAPVQVSWLGYFATTGMKEMDYLLADHVGVPEHLREQFTESIYYLPETRLCFSPPQLDLAVAPLPALTNSSVTFGCYQNLPKVGENVLAVWARIFAAMPNARLRMQCPQLDNPDSSKLMYQRLSHHGIDASRVTMSGSVPRVAYLESHGEVDVILDTFPYPGGTTTCEALWMGVPTLTLAGNTLLARQGASLLTAAGLDDWIAATEEEYIAMAVAYASDITRLAELRTTLRDRVLKSPLFNSARFAGSLESAFWELWGRFDKLDSE